MTNATDKKAFSRQLRKDSTDAERALWSRLRAGQLMGTKWRRQVPLGPYFADFYCHAARLVLELGISMLNPQAWKPIKFVQPFLRHAGTACCGS